MYEEWLRRHRPSPSDYPESNAPIGHNGGYHMVPFLPLHRNREYFVSSKDLGYDYTYLLDASEFAFFRYLHKCQVKGPVYKIWGTFTHQVNTQTHLLPGT